MLPDLAPATLSALAEALPPFATPRNPVDAYGLGWDAQRFEHILHTVLADPAIGTAMLCMDTFEPGVESTMSEELARVCTGVPRDTDKALVFVNNTSGGGINPEICKRLRAHAVPALLGMREGIAAVAAWRRAQGRRAEPPEAALPSTAWRERVAGAREETERVALLGEAGVPMAATRAVDSADAAVAVAAELEGPVALKGSAPGLLHKTEHGLVEIGLRGEVALRGAFAALRERLARIPGGRDEGRVLVQRMAGEGVELILGARHVPGFGTVIAVGPGGTLVELLRGASIRLAPVGRATALAMLEESAAGRLLRGVRGRGPFDRDAAAAAIVAFSRFAQGAGDALRAVEINPLIVLEAGRGVVGVDVVFET